MSDYFGLEAERRERNGLYGKYEVLEVLDLGGFADADCFVLRPTKDPTALAALIHYAALTPNEALAADLEDWIKRIGEDRR